MQTNRWIGGLLFLSVVILLCPFLGAEPIALGDFADSTSISHRLLFTLRFPRYLLLLVAGGSLAVLGGTYQTLFQNALADPYVLGVSSATTLGIALAEIFFRVPAASLASQGIGLGAAFLATLLLLGVGASHLGQRPERLVLFGMGLNFVLSSALFLVLSYHYQHMGGGSLRWLFGQIPWVSGREALLFAATALPFLILLPLLARRLDAMALGDGVSRSLGVSPGQTRLCFIFITSALLGLVVCFTGSIGFVGLVVPHGVRLVGRPTSTRALMAGAFVVGAAFLCVSDVISRVLLPPFEFPIGVITTLVGGPLFLVLLWRRP